MLLVYHGHVLLLGSASDEHVVAEGAARAFCVATEQIHARARHVHLRLLLRLLELPRGFPRLVQLACEASPFLSITLKLIFTLPF